MTLEDSLKIDKLDGLLFLGGGSITPSPDEPTPEEQINALVDDYGRFISDDLARFIQANP